MLYIINGGNSECFFAASRIFVLTSPLKESLCEKNVSCKVVEAVDNIKPFQTIRLSRMAWRMFAVCVQYQSSSAFHGYAFDCFLQSPSEKFMLTTRENGNYIYYS